MRVRFTAIELSWCPCPFLSLSLVSMSTAESLWQKAKSQLDVFRDKRPLLAITTNKHTYCFQHNYSERRLIREFLNKPVSFFLRHGTPQSFCTFKKFWFDKLPNGNAVFIDSNDSLLPSLPYGTLGQATSCMSAHLYQCEVKLPLEPPLHFSQWNGRCWNIISAAFVSRRC